MNLVKEPWIPVVRPDGVKENIGLADIFGRGGDIRDLACNPPQRIALMRLLVCIAQAALNGPEDEEDWFNCKDRIPGAAEKYLAEWRDSFELFGKHPFMQIPDLRVAKGKEKPLDELDCNFAKGNMSVLFDHSAVPEGRCFTESQIALAFLTLLNFSPGGKVGQCIWNKKNYSESTFAAPCVNHAFGFVRGANLLTTIHFNLLTKNGQTTGVCRLPNGEWGKPVWEFFPENVDDHDSFRNASETYLGRLVPLSRFVNLSGYSDKKCIIGPTHHGYRIDHLPAFREPWATVVSRKDGTPAYLRLDETKHMWRELHSVLSLRHTQYGVQGSVSLCNLNNFFDLFPDAKVDIWVGGLKCDKAKFVDMLDWGFTVNPGDLHETFIEKYAKGVEFAQTSSSRLEKAVKECFKFMKVEAKAIPTSKALRHYWSELDGQSDVLKAVAADDSSCLGERWYEVVVNALRGAYSLVCPCETSRQVEAYAKGLAMLSVKRPAG